MPLRRETFVGQDLRCWMRSLPSLFRLLKILMAAVVQLNLPSGASSLDSTSAKRKGPPQLLPQEQATERMLMVGDTLRLICPAVAHPQAMVTWQKDSQTVQPVGWDRYELTPEGVLFVFDLEVTDSGAYTCRATNGFGSVQFQYQVTVLAPASGVPEFIAPYMANVTACVDSSVVFRCHVRSSSQPSIQWLKRVEGLEEIPDRTNVTIEVENRKYLVLQKGPVHPRDLISGSYISKFTIVSASLQDSGLYICVATNLEGYSISNAFLQITSRSRNVSSVNELLVFEYSSTSWLLPLVIFVVLVLVTSLCLVALFVCGQRRRWRSPKGQQLTDGHDNGRCSSLASPLPEAASISTGFLVSNSLDRSKYPPLESCYCNDNRCRRATGKWFLSAEQCPSKCLLQDCIHSSGIHRVVKSEFNEAPAVTVFNWPTV